MGRDRDERVGEVGGPRGRHVHPPEDAERAATLDPRGLVEFLGDLLEGLAHQEDAEGRSHVGRPDPEDCVEQPQPRRDRIVLDDQHLGQNEELQEHQYEQGVLEGDVDLGECKTRECAQHELPGEHGRHQQESVQEIPQPRRALPSRAEVFQCRGRGEIEVDRVGRSMERGPKSEEQG